MKTQSDRRIRVVNLTNLEEMCKRISGVCRRYEVTKVSRSRVHVTYSNPNEYGTEASVTAVLPCYPNTASGNEENPDVVFDPLRYTGGRGSYDYQAFDALWDAPTVWRAGLDGQPWHTHKEILSMRSSREIQEAGTVPDTCTVCDVERS